MIMTDDCLEGRHQGAGLDGLPRFRDGGLESVRFRRLPILEDLANTGRIDVAGCSDAAGPAKFRGRERNPPFFVLLLPLLPVNV